LQNYTYGTPYPNHPLLTLTQWNGALQPTTLLTIEYSAYIYNAQGSAGGDDIGGNDSWNILQGDPTDVYGGNDWLRGFAGNDTIYGVGGSDLIEGGDNNDQLYGDWDTEAQDQGNFGTGDDTVDGGAGDDSIWSDAGQNVLIGGQHRDTVIYSGFFDTGVTYYHAVINLQAGTAAVSATDTYSGDEYQVASDSLSGFEHVLGTDGDDIIIGYAAEPYSGAWISLDGRYGNDSLVGGTGGEDLMGGAGNDTLVCGDVAGARALGDYLAGGAGNDTYVLTADAIIDEYNYGGGGVDTLVLGYAATDFALLEGALEHLVMQTGAGAAPVTGNTAANSMTGNSFGNWMSGLAGADTLTGGNGADSLYGGLNRDTLWGGNGNDVVAGGGDHDYLSGGAGNDTLNGSSGNDTLVGNTGRDFMTGGVGRDLFVFKNGADGGTGTAADRITDFVSGEDRISLKDVCRADYFIGPDVFGGRAGEWRYLDTTGQLQADIDGNGRADFVVNLGAGTVLLASDLIL
jgi:Ca2+-binding RTX toxin-like protein